MILSKVGGAPLVGFHEEGGGLSLSQQARVKGGRFQAGRGLQVARPLARKGRGTYQTGPVDNL